MDTNFSKFSLPRYDEYADQMVAYVDILGFDKQIMDIQCENDFKKVGNLLFTLKEIDKMINAAADALRNLNVTSISDSLIFTMPVTDPTPPGMSLIWILHWIQYLLLEAFGKLIRGYLTRGPVYHKKNILFGKGYSEAYRKEQDIGQAPRIVIDPSLVEEAKLNYGEHFHSHVLNFIIQDSYDGYYFIDYLKPVGQQAEIDIQILIKQREIIKAFVQSSLKAFSDKEKILRKYNWLNNYISLTEHYYE